MQLLQEADIYAKPVGDLISLNEHRKISTPVGVFCSVIFAAFGIASLGFLIAGMTGGDHYYSQSVAWTNLGRTEAQQEISLDQVIISYDLSLPQEYMLGAFL
jgi:hypothetical protein